jgi:hypothetical protein
MLKNAHLRRYPHFSSLRRTSMYASLFGISGALHLNVFEHPEQQVFFSHLQVDGFVKNPVHPSIPCSHSALPRAGKAHGEQTG